MMMRSWIAFSTLCAGAYATSPEEQSPMLAFDWDSHLQALGLEENNSTAGAGGCAQACVILQHVLPQREFDPLTTPYYKEKSLFWSNQQAEVSPACFVQPANAHEVASIIQAVERAGCAFAVKSGGHAAFAGASNIANGITIDLALLDEVSVSDDRTTTRVGAGNRWAGVYEHLDPKNLSVVGGRLSEVGVGGLLLGGGLSFFAGRYGWGLDGVRNYELVTAGGRVLDVNLTSHPDLYWALRGGGNNFGVVTRFDLETFSQGPMWGGSIVTDFSQREAVQRAFTDFTFNAAADVDAQAFVAFVFFGAQQAWLTSTQLTHASPPSWTADEDPAQWYPEIFADFSALPTLQSTLRRSNMSDLALEINATSPNGLRNTYWTWTFAADQAMMDYSLRVFEEQVATVAHLPHMLTALVFQQVSTAVIARFRRNGGNSLGIEEGDGPLFIANLNFMWSDPAEDPLVYAAARNTFARSADEARRRGLHHRYLYQNYAAAEQRVFEGYGEENVARLREISARYDPEQTFQRLQPGYFKLYWDGE